MRGLVFVVGFLAICGEYSSATEVRIRLNQSMRIQRSKYEETAFRYEKLEGVVLCVDSDSLTLQTNGSSGGPVRIALSSIKEMQRRATFAPEWIVVTLPVGDASTLRRWLSVPERYILRPIGGPHSVNSARFKYDGGSQWLYGSVAEATVDTLLLLVAEGAGVREVLLTRSEIRTGVLQRRSIDHHSWRTGGLIGGVAGFMVGAALASAGSEESFTPNLISPALAGAILSIPGAIAGAALGAAADAVTKWEDVTTTNGLGRQVDQCPSDIRSSVGAGT